MTNIYEIKTIEEMILYLKDRGISHRNYYHYTIWDALEKIINKGTFLLTRGNSMNINDQHEALMKGSWLEWNKTYLGSFSFGESENMAMWGLYGLPWEDAVRICIPKAAMNRWISSIEHVGVWRNNQIVGYVNDADISLNDVVYVSGKRNDYNMRLTHAGKTMSTSKSTALRGIDCAPQMTGYIKNYAWKYENEVRILVRVKQDVGSEKICIKIPPDVIDSMTITTGPSFEWRNDPLYIFLSENGRIGQSAFLHLVKYRSICSMCQHKQFILKQT